MSRVIWGFAISPRSSIEFAPIWPETHAQILCLTRGQLGWWMRPGDFHRTRKSPRPWPQITFLSSAAPHSLAPSSHPILMGFMRTNIKSELWALIYTPSRHGETRNASLWFQQEARRKSISSAANICSSVIHVPKIRSSMVRFSAGVTPSWPLLCSSFSWLSQGGSWPGLAPTQRDPFKISLQRHRPESRSPLLGHW